MLNVALAVLRSGWLYLAAALAGFVLAWSAPGLRLTAAQQEFTAYKLDQQQASNAAADRATKQREESAHAYQILNAQLNQEIESGAVYRRCVAAGKCGRLQQRPASLPAAAVPPGTGIDAARPDTVPTAGDDAALAGDCAVTTLRLNQLQEAIEKQPGY